VKTVPTIREAFLCVIRHPKAFIPYLVFSILFLFIFTWILTNFVNTISEPTENLADAFYESLRAFSFFIVTGVLLFIAYEVLSPFFEGLTYAALGSAFRNEPVLLRKAAGKALSKYPGILVITIIAAIITLIVGSLITSVVSLVLFSSMSFFSILFTLNPYSILAWVGLVFFVTRVIVVLFIYLKPAYILGDKHFAKSLYDGVKTVVKNFVPSCLIYLGFAVMRIVLFGITFSGMIMSTVIPKAAYVRVAGLLGYYVLCMVKILISALFCITVSFIVRIVDQVQPYQK